MNTPLSWIKAYVPGLDVTAQELSLIHIFRHKTLHKKFTIGVPAMIAVQLALIAGLAVWF